ncbi:MAG TPA: ParB/RepB/Spo0J family partition protein [Chloroflexota bacterium]
MPTHTKQPLSYEEAAAKAGVVSTVPLGVRPIRVRRIVGSAGKADKIAPTFLPLGAGPAQANYRSILNAMKSGQELPPISVYQLGSRFFVIDGHTRVAAAKALGIDFLDAYVTEALPRKEGEVNLTYYARREFERATGLEGIRLTAAWRYHLLHHHVEGYRLYLEMSLGRDVSLQEAARIWFRSQYQPTLLEIRRRGLSSTTGGRTSGDIYTDILKAWTEQQALNVSLREMLDRYDQSQERSTLTRAKRAVTGVVDASLPKAIPPLAKPRPRELAEEDVDAELEASSIESPLPSQHPTPRD